MKVYIRINSEEINDALTQEKTREYCQKLLEALIEQENSHQKWIAEIAKKQMSRWEELKTIAEQNHGWITKEFIRIRRKFWTKKKKQSRR